jgi:ribonuclease VapC
MMIFVDASILVAILRREQDYARLPGVIFDSAGSVTSRLALWEACARMHAISLKQDEKITAAAIADAVMVLLRSLEIALVDDDPADWRTALDAVARFGRAAGHPAALNMGDCFHYAVCKRLGARMLAVSTGEFAMTDLACISWR